MKFDFPNLEQLTEWMREHAVRREEDKERRTNSGEDINCFVKKNACYSWTCGGIDFWLCKNQWRQDCGYVRFPARPVKEKGTGGILTYVPVHGGITWAQRSPDNSFVYGFDCGHCGDLLDEPFGQMEKRFAKFKRTRNEKDLFARPKRRTLKWLRSQVECMAAGILCAARIEDDYLKATAEVKPVYEGWQAACEQYGSDSSVADAYKPKLIAANQVVGLILDRFHKYLDDEGFGRFILGENMGAMINLISGRL